QLGAGQVPDLVVAVLVLLVAPALARDPLTVGGVTVGPEPDRDHLTRHGILLQAHVWQEETVQHVAALEVDARVGAHPGVDLVDGVDSGGGTGAVVAPRLGLCRRILRRPLLRPRGGSHRLARLLAGVAHPPLELAGAYFDDVVRRTQL